MMRRVIQITAALAFVFLGPAEAIANRICWWLM